MNSIEKLKLLHPDLIQNAIDGYNQAVKDTPKGIHPVIDETYRSIERSNELYNQPHDGKDNDGDGKIDEADEKVSNAKGGQSWHNFGLAFDFHLVVNGKDYWPSDEKAAMKDKNWMTVVNIFKSRGWNWGGEFPGSFKDSPHLEYKFGKTLSQLNELRNKKSFIIGTEYVKL